MANQPISPRRIPEALSEALGTFLLVLIGTSALTAINIAGQATTPLVIIVIALAFSLPLIWLITHLSQHRLGQFNPAITLLLLLNQKISLVQAAINMLSQLAAALVASIAVGLLYGSPGVEIGLGSPQPLTSMGEMAALSGELLGSLIIFITILYQLRTNQSFKQMAPQIGLSVAIASLMAAGISGASFNPFRAIAPQLASDSTHSLWLYLAAPFAAAILATIMDQAARVQVLVKEAGQYESSSSEAEIPAQQESEIVVDLPTTSSFEQEPVQTDQMDQIDMRATTKPQRPHLSFSNFNNNLTTSTEESIEEVAPQATIEMQPGPIQDIPSNPPQLSVDSTIDVSPTIVQPRPTPAKKPTSTSKTKLSFIDYEGNDDES